jgi:peptidoglycan hydrolase CwlO-like protein
MKKIVSYFLLLNLIFLSACSSNDTKTQKKTTTNVVGEMSEEDKALEKEMEELDEDIEELKSIKK